MEEMNNQRIDIIGGGLAGCEAAWQLLRAGFAVRMFERRPASPSPAHATDRLAELVCSNSLRSDLLTSAAGLLKAEMRMLDSLIISAADAHKVPAGQALAVDRVAFYDEIEKRLRSFDNYELVLKEITELPADEPAIVATGPLTSDTLSSHLSELLGSEHLYFYDAIAPIIEGDSVDQDAAFWASRYDKGEADGYLNCPLNQEEYSAFIAALRESDQYPTHDFEDVRHFEGCLPIEEMAQRGDDTLRFGPMKPVGLTDPRTGQMPYAVLQLRRDDLAAEHFNMVGFQTKMRKADQKRVFRLIPALCKARFSRLGQMHRNSFVNAPTVLDATYQVRDRPHLFIAGQLSGVEGYIESAASGLASSIYMIQLLRTGAISTMPPSTAMGALGHYIANAEPKEFQPMNITFGLLMQENVKPRRPRRERREAQSNMALEEMKKWIEANS